MPGQQTLKNVIHKKIMLNNQRTNKHVNTRAIVQKS